MGDFAGLAWLFDAGAALLLNRPDPALLEAAAVVLPELPAQQGATLAVGEVAAEAVAEAVALSVEDWSDLFFSPRSGRYLPPLESVFREGRLSGEAAWNARQAYEAAGFEPAQLDMDPLWRAIPHPDHLGFELAFVSALLRCADEDAAGAAALHATARAFHAERIAPWAGAYGLKLAEAARSPLYKAAGALLQELAAPLAAR
ncbi:molecular chaperone TorD family protein [Fundidesulfovibrio agrisoli]|uniref:molecular chaperone TorD family protein n=1 Tax=Fundidesulfovibrio agrisoli TaxID=2922717 RepID=UPI001FAE0C51|nr:molecular chaperone TorD family protein [Fundidesulfovibrio agrisoli]